MIAILRHFTAIYAGLTLGYWFTIVLELSQVNGYLLACVGAITLFFISMKFQDQESDSKLMADATLLFISIALAIFTSCLYAFNPDDATFFHRVNHLLAHSDVALPDYDTRFAFDKLPPISAAHLISSWEYILSLFGGLFGSALIGYQIGGTFVSIIFYVAATLYTLKHFLPKINLFVQISSVVVLFGFLILDADQNRRIGSWLFLGGWTGKCFLSAALIALFPATDRAFDTNDWKDWFFVFCLIVFFLGLSGSALFIIPIGIGVLILVEIFFRHNFISRYPALLLLLMPLVVGSIFIYKFGGLSDDSYWRRGENVPFFDYMRTTIADHQLWLYVGFIPVLLNKNSDIINRSALKTFALYQIALAVILFNPYLVEIFEVYIPPDGFWRAYFLFQYPTLIIVISAIVMHSIILRLYLQCLLPGLALLLSLYGSMSIFQLQVAWGYQQHFKSLSLPKLETIEIESVHDAAQHCPVLKKGGVVLAPEEWEVAVQMLFPSVTTVSARHMHHNFLNSKTGEISVAESIRRGATEYVSGIDTGSIGSLMSVIDHKIDMVVVRQEVSVLVAPLLLNYTQVSSDQKYMVFCLNKSLQNE